MLFWFEGSGRPTVSEITGTCSQRFFLIYVAVAESFAEAYVGFCGFRVDDEKLRARWRFVKKTQSGEQMQAKLHAGKSQTPNPKP